MTDGHHDFWDENAEARHHQIMSGNDLSYDYVLWPNLSKLLLDLPKGNLLDGGCGSGVISSRLAADGWTVTGLDSSYGMIAIANREFGKQTGLSFSQGRLEDVHKLYGPDAFSAVVLNMSIVGLDELESVFSAVRAVVKPGGVLVISTIHPWFWRLYKKHTQAQANYWKTLASYDEFVISKDRKPLPQRTKIVYRTLEDHFSALASAGFTVENLAEPEPPNEILLRYGTTWEHPRFLFLRCRASFPI